MKIFKYLNNKELNKINNDTIKNISIEGKIIPKANLIKCKNLIETKFESYLLMFIIQSIIEWILNSTKKEQIIDSISIPILTQDDSNIIFDDLKNYKTLKSGAYGITYLLHLYKNRFPIVIKSPKNKDVSEILHEYLIAINGTNLLRKFIPNFTYTFGIYYTDKNNSRLIMEKIDGGISFIDYLRRISFLKYSTSNINNFLILFIQLLLSLDLSQQKCFFTHYDLHGENVLLRLKKQDSLSIRYPLFNYEYIINDPEYIVSIIDFGCSTITIDQGFFGDKHFDVYGMYAFYLPGADMAKFLLYCYFNLFFNNSFLMDTNGYYLKSFFEHILHDIYHVQFTKPRNDFFINYKTILNSFYNITNNPRIFMSPYNIIEYLELKSNIIFNILNIKNYPWIKRSIQKYKKNYNDSEIKECISNTFCTKIKTNINDIITKSDLIITSNDLIILDKIFIKKFEFPTPQKSNSSLIKTIINYPHWNNFLIISEKIFDALEKNIKFNKDINMYIKINLRKIIYNYRSYISLKEFLVYYKL